MDDLLDVCAWVVRQLVEGLLWRSRLRGFLILAGVVMLVLLWLWGAIPFARSPLPAWR